MKKWRIFYEQNGGEYVGYIVIKAKKLNAEIGGNLIKADNVEIEMDEKIVEFEEIS